MLLPQKITSSETKYKIILEEFFNRIFDKTFLPSHGIEHHRRVWQYAKELLIHIHNQGFNPDPSITDKLIIACYLHDSGLSVDSGFRHGTEGRNICERFLSENKLPVKEYTDVLEAIENHDNKEYKVLYRPEDLDTILMIADDLDAFGFIGIYRYLDIYIERNIPLNGIGILITENCENRFQNFIRTYRFSDELVEKHTKRFEIINSFFYSYNLQAEYYKFDNQLIAGYCGVAEIISGMRKNKKSETDFLFEASEFSDPAIQWYFTELNYELSGFRGMQNPSL
jgi:hypothetical protein